ncbi:MAG: hypothetical protein EOO50_11710 [Flavobacterium sp.]|uniref:phosphodiester glycosidase family protein n=1 Tax=Flavobacterium sp. TaxID=239 RepID=UPI0012166552|nr:phosphodiester glycosidase family protein [Flavobacterium sp.]RZJ65926.1 MAG: hypothetical protein EOO50_11710 [Flavobacterium sp.]
MKNLRLIGLLCLLLLMSASAGIKQSNIISYRANLSKVHFALYWKDAKGNRIASLGNLRKLVEKQNKTLLFAMNAGMFKKDFSPQGLYIENGKVLIARDNSGGNGNFYLKPNGIFCVDRNGIPTIRETENYIDSKSCRYATQSGPMLVIEGELHPAFKKGSANLNVRNGVGILPNGEVLFAISKTEINFYDFAMFFKDAGCKNALYLDGFVSRAYVSGTKTMQTDGDFGAMIGVALPR